MNFGYNGETTLRNVIILEDNALYRKGLTIYNLKINWLHRRLQYRHITGKGQHYVE
jgi:hypothetical protein